MGFPKKNSSAIWWQPEAVSGTEELGLGFPHKSQPWEVRGQAYSKEKGIKHLRIKHPHPAAFGISDSGEYGRKVACVSYMKAVNLTSPYEVLVWMK